MSTVDASVELLDADLAQTLFCASSPVTFLDHFRVPYEVAPHAVRSGVQQLWMPRGGPRLLWRAGTPARAQRVVISDSAAGIPIFASILSDASVQLILEQQGGMWERAREVTSPDGEPLGWIWREADGSVFLPFDPNEVIHSFWTERYLEVSSGGRLRGGRRRLVRAYYRVRPVLPRRVQIALRRRFARLQARSRFPRWPVETCLHDFFDLMFAILAGIAGGAIPHIAPWPDGYEWALVLTHDVEHATGLAFAPEVLGVEADHGLRSAWNIVPRRYPVDLSEVRTLIAAGCEVGVHGIDHDGRDLESLATWQDRLPEARRAAEAWGAIGFRSAALHRDPEWLQLLECEYDSSFPDTDPFEPQDGGCCTWLPFFHGSMVELPLTLPQDHTLFVILGQSDATMWIDKAEFLRGRGGLALVDTHPDYLVNDPILAAYRQFLQHFATDATAWHALPREVCAWWRLRAESSLYRDDDGWQISGPAGADARIAYRGGSW